MRYLVTLYLAVGLLHPMFTHAAQLEIHPPGQFSDVIPTMRTGDTLVVGDGTYRDQLTINCRGSAAQGSAGAPITVRAEHERQSLLTGGVEIRGCAYWQLIGLQVRSADNAGVGGAAISVDDSSHLTLRRLLVHHSNRYLNVPLLLLNQTNDSLVEESEFYFFHRNGVSTKYGQGNTFVRNYFNSRGYGDISGGNDSGTEGRGDTALTLYPGSNHLLENNISEGNAAAWDTPATAPSVNNRVLGHISLHDNHGAILHARGDSSSTMPTNTLIENFVVISPTFTGVYARGAKNTHCNNCSVFDGQMGLIADQQAAHHGDGQASFFAENALVVGNSRVGIQIGEQVYWGVDSPNAYGNAVAFDPAGASQITNARAMNPSMGSCKVYIPEGSPLKRAGTGGRDIGANVLYRYENGTPTNQPLWGPGFPCGAIVGGVNDVAGSSCFDVHQRLNVNANGCALPDGYEGGGTPPPPPGPLPPPHHFRMVRQP